jgi:Cu(I)/Ag(I) efflux system membrane fusion protein
VAIPSPYGGTVIEKPAVEGARFMAGEPLYRIVDLSRVWVIAQVFEQDLTSVALGQAAVVRVQAYPDRSFPGRVGFLYPTVGRETRTAQVRIELANPGGALKADMVASVEIAAPVGRRSVLTVPDSAVIDSGARQVVLIEKGEGRFEPRPVRIGARGDGHVQVLDGVASGDRVVVSANFLIDAESNLKAALQAFGADGAAAGHQH